MARGQLPAASHRSKTMRLFPRDIIPTSTEDGAVLLIATKDDGDPQELELELPFDLAEKLESQFHAALIIARAILRSPEE
jgi:hypothetical protein